MSNEILHTEQYQGHTITIEKPPVHHGYNGRVQDGAKHSQDVAWWSRGVIWERIEAGDYAKAVRKLREAVDLWIADDEIKPRLIPLIAYDRNGDALAAPGGLPPVDSVAWVFAMGGWRRGLVTKQTRSKVEVAYTTASSNGRVFRKMAGLGQGLAV